MAAAAILKISKIAISPQQFDRSLRNLARLCKIGLLTVLAVKKFEFPKSKMAERKQQPTTEGETEVLVYKMKCTSRSQIQTQENKKANINVKNLTV